MLQHWLIKIASCCLLLRRQSHGCPLVVLTGRLLRRLGWLSFLRHKASVKPVGVVRPRVAVGRRFVANSALLHLLRRRNAGRLSLKLKALYRRDWQLPSLLTAALLLGEVRQRNNVRLG